MIYFHLTISTFCHNSFFVNLNLSHNYDFLSYVAEVGFHSTNPFESVNSIIKLTQ